MKWITRSHVHVDRVACSWLITRFIDNEAEFLFVPASQIDRIAKETGAIRSTRRGSSSDIRPMVAAPSSRSSPSTA
jgi:hypothetical protein